MFPKHATFTAGETEDIGRDCSGQEVAEPRVCLPVGCPSLLAAATDFHCSKAIAPAKAAFNR